jgi:hypothetical protein
MDGELMKELGRMGVGGAVAILIFIFYRQDRKDSDARYTEDRRDSEKRYTELTLSVKEAMQAQTISNNNQTMVNTRLCTLIESQTRNGSYCSHSKEPQK